MKGNHLVRTVLTRLTVVAAGLAGRTIRSLPGLAGATSVAAGVGIRFGLWAGLVTAGVFGLWADRGMR